MQKTLRPLVAEFVGVFFLVFAGTGAIVVNTYREGTVGLVGIALAFGLALAIAVSATLNVSGGHINPAVTLGLWSIGRIGWRQAGLYVAAQLLGAVVASLAIKGLYPEMAGRIAQLGAPQLAPVLTLAQGIVIEAILTFFLAFAVMATVVDPAGPKVAGFAVGLTLTVGILAGGPLTGGALNPARAFGPALVANAWLAQLVFWIGPILGAIAAMQLYERLLLKRDAA
jgi:MIP family channel proteins